MLEQFLRTNDLRDSENIDLLLDFASLLRQLVQEKQYEAISAAIRHTAEHNCYEALFWALGVLQEEFEQEEGCLENFDCQLGRAISSYDEFREKLQIDSNIEKNEIETVHDENGEVQSFFNIFTYRSGFENIYLVSSENFDTKDNDFIQYKLSFVRKQK